jgi:plastocyanin
MMITRKHVQMLLGALMSVVLSLALSACGGGSSSGGTGAAPGGSTGGSTGGGTAGGTAVVEKDFQFNPSSLTVKVGDKVTFANQDSVVHRVVVGTTDLGDQQPGQSVTWTADKAGTFPVKCSIHPGMTGQITVGAGGGGSSGGSSL